MKIELSNGFLKQEAIEYLVQSVEKKSLLNFLRSQKRLKMRNLRRW